MKTKKKRPKGWYWPYIIVGFLVIPVIIDGVMLAKALGDPSFAVERNYYERARSWNEVQAQRAVNQELGWRLSPRLFLEPSGQGLLLETTLRDGGGELLPGAAVEVEAFPYARANEVCRAELRDRGDGVHLAALPATRRGQWRLRFRATHGERLFTQELTVTVP